MQGGRLQRDNICTQGIEVGEALYRIQKERRWKRASLVSISVLPLTKQIKEYMCVKVATSIDQTNH